MQTNYKQSRGTWDTMYSTYFWKIHLDKTDPRNTAECLTGYSKMLNESEAQDKDYLLKRKIVNLFTNGYLTKATRIEFFARVGTVVDKSKDPNILIVYPTHYDIPELNHSVIYKKFGVWLTDFFYRINNKKSMDDILPAIRKPKSKDDYMNIERHQFSTVAQLYTYSAKLLVHHHPQGEVDNFILKYKQKRGW